MVKSDYQIRAVLVEELPLLADLERSAAALFSDTHIRSYYHVLQTNKTS
jgi:hypothetical protein